MDNGRITEQQVPSGNIAGLKLELLTAGSIDLFSNIVITENSDLTGPKLGVPNELSSHCYTCGASDTKHCDGHYGYIELPANICHPYNVPKIVQLLNKLCPGCGSVKLSKKTKDVGLSPLLKQRKYRNMGCKYCSGKSIERYPQLKYKYRKRTLEIFAIVNEEKFRSKYDCEKLPDDYWDFVPKVQQPQSASSFEMTFSPYQVYCLIKDLHPDLLSKFSLTKELMFIRRFPVTANCSRVMEKMEDGSQAWHFDDLTKAYKRLVDIKRRVDVFGPRSVQSLCVGQGSSIPTEVGNRLWDCIKVSKLFNRSSSSTKTDSQGSGLRWVKDTVLGKRSDNTFRMVVVGDPKIRLGEIGIPNNISGELVIAEYVNSQNMEKLQEFGKNAYVLKKGGIFSLRGVKNLQLGDRVDRPLRDGDIVLINRPPSVHHHSLLAFSVKILPKDSVVSINPLSCAPFKGDFDGDCLHGFIPQSVECRVELSELLSLNQQLANEQNGHDLLSLTHDSLTAAYLLTSDNIFLNKFQIQQMQMLGHHYFLDPTIYRTPVTNKLLWTGKRLFSLVLPQSFNFVFPSNGVHIKEGHLLTSSNRSAWLRNTQGSLFSSLIKSYPCQGLEFLFIAQDILCEWISSRGLSVSLLDFYLIPDSNARRKIMEEVGLSLGEVESICHTQDRIMASAEQHLLMHDESGQDRSFDFKSHFNKQKVCFNLGISAYKEMNQEFQSMICDYAFKDNSILAMVNAGSNGNLTKLVQQSLCLGLQQSTTPLSFRIPSKLDSRILDQEMFGGLHEKTAYYGFVRSSFLGGLNPLECFVHALSSRGTLFSDNADLPGTLTRKLMFYMRDISVAYDGTVRSAYGNKIIQFSYGTSTDNPDSECSVECRGAGGQPVGALAACSVSEAAYSALDQPITTETSPLVNLKKLMECSGKGSSGPQTISIYLSDKLRRWNNGQELGALEVKSHLERVLFSDIVATVMIVFSEQEFCDVELGPWVGHFHICQEMMKKRRLSIQGVVDALIRVYKSSRRKTRSLPSLQICSGECSFIDSSKGDPRLVCISAAVEISEFNDNLGTLRDEVLPNLLRTTIKGFLDFKKVEILWEDHCKASRLVNNSMGELLIKVHRSESCNQTKFWSSLLDACIPIKDLINWEKSHPDNLCDIFSAFGVDAAWKHFFRTMKSTISDIGRNICQDHLLLIADCLSVTGEFHGLNAKGIEKQMDQMAISSPFMQACFSNPSKQFIKSAKKGAKDDLLGALDAAAWGKEAPLGSGGPFEILYSGKGQNLVNPFEVYDKLLLSHSASCKNIPLNCGDKILGPEDNYSFEEAAECLELDEDFSLVDMSSPVDVVGMLSKFREMLHKYPVNVHLNKTDRSLLMKALSYHPQGNAKLGAGVKAIKVGRHPLHPSKCFMIVRKDGTEEDFSYLKCVMGAAKQISPDLENAFRKELYKGKSR
ncbi:DNA-directed RNA polymerase IV subunit 1 isoform X2 [Aristolochia californica]